MSLPHVDWPAVGIRPVVQTDVPTIAALLARTFIETPFHAWAYGSEPADFTERHFADHVVDAIHRQGAFVTRGCEAVALWDGAPPPRKISSGGTHSRRYLDAINQILAHRPDVAHVYLDVLATDARFRGRGHARALLAPMMAACDVAGSPIYLETDLESNVALYERFGFTLAGNIALAHNGPTLYKMLRKPHKTHG